MKGALGAKVVETHTEKVLSMRSALKCHYTLNYFGCCLVWEFFPLLSLKCWLRAAGFTVGTTCAFCFRAEESSKTTDDYFFPPSLWTHQLTAFRSPHLCLVKNRMNVLWGKHDRVSSQPLGWQSLVLECPGKQNILSQHPSVTQKLPFYSYQSECTF